MYLPEKQSQQWEEGKKRMLKFDRQGLIPAVIQDDASGEVLMVAFMNEEALQKTRETGYTHFYSRSRHALWRKGEQSGKVQEVQAIFVNCEENSLLIRVVQHGGAACHTGYRSCYYRRLLPDDSYETVAEQVFDPAIVYARTSTQNAMQRFLIASEYNDASMATEEASTLESYMRKLYGAYLYLRDHDLSEQSNTSRLLQEHSPVYLAGRLADELQELADVQSGEHMHSGRQPDTILEGSQVGYWLMLLAATYRLRYEDILPHVSLLRGYYDPHDDGEGTAIELRQECLNLLSSEPAQIAQGIQLGFVLVGWFCAEAGISPLAPAEYDLEQMRRKGLVE
jgi:phosphoribosyl-AMP cyclohydrolase